jgi:hypothetical protein
LVWDQRGETGRSKSFPRILLHWFCRGGEAGHDSEIPPLDGFSLGPAMASGIFACLRSMPVENKYRASKQERSEQWHPGGEMRNCGGATWPANRVAELTPMAWKAAHKS